MKLKNISKIIILLILFSLNSCSSDKDSESGNPNSKLIIGKWTWQDPKNQCPSFREFKTNKTLAYVQYVENCEPETDNLSYELVGNEIKVNNDEDKTEKIIELTEKTMTTTFVDYSGTHAVTYTKIP